MPVLEVKGLSCSFRTNTVQRSGGGMKTVLSGVSFSVEERSCLGLIGDSGSGKSTIARCIAGLAMPDDGSICIMGKNVFPNVRNRRAMPGSVQMLFQDHSASLDPVMTVRNTLAEGIRAYAGSETVDDTSIGRLLHRVGLPTDAAEKYPGHLSGGERQRVALARALSVKPALLVLDEPTSSLDAVTQLQILLLIQSVQKTEKTAILFISHDIEAIVRVCDHVAVLYDGRIVEYGATGAILVQPQHPYTQRIAALHHEATRYIAMPAE